MWDKAVLLSPTGMLSDKHVDAASTLLAGQFPRILSSMKLQSHLGLLPVDHEASTYTQTARVQGYIYTMSCSNNYVYTCTHVYTLSVLVV